MASADGGSQRPPILRLDSNRSQIICQAMAVAKALAGWNQVREGYSLFHDPEGFLSQMHLLQKSCEILSGSLCFQRLHC
jgi:hypothetical protein